VAWGKLSAASVLPARPVVAALLVVPRRLADSLQPSN
jgi:hypothetical protein